MFLKILIIFAVILTAFVFTAGIYFYSKIEQVWAPIFEEMSDFLTEISEKIKIVAGMMNYELDVAKKCDGKMFDARADFKGKNSPEKLQKQMEEQGIGCALGDITVDYANLNNSLADVEKQLAPYNDSLIPLLNLKTTIVADMEREKLDNVLEHKIKIPFRGISGISFLEEPWSKTSLFDAPWHNNFHIKEEEKFIIMLRLRNNQTEELEKMARAHLKTEIVIYGDDLRQDLARLLKENPNLYFALDAVTLLSPIADDIDEPEEFLKSYDANWQSRLSIGIKEWLPVISVAPNQVLWGVGATYTSQTDEKIYAKLIEFSKLFINQLPLEYRQKYAYENAVELLGSKR